MGHGVSSVRPVFPATSTRSRAPRAEDRSRTAHRSGIGTWHPPDPSGRSSCWLPRRHRACPSAALDERVFGEDGYHGVGAPVGQPRSAASRRPRVRLVPMAVRAPTSPSWSTPSRPRAPRSRCASRPATRRRRSARSSPPCAATWWSTPPLVDEVVVIDDGSTDATAEAARWEGARVLAVDDDPPRAAPRARARATRCGCRCTRATATSCAGSTPTSATSAPHFVTRLLAPLLTDPAIGFVKGYYRRPLHGEATGGGRVTELMARPADLRRCSPISPDSCSRSPVSTRDGATLLETVPFVEGWGVEIGLLIDLVANFGIDAIAQVDLDVREHRNRPLDELGPQAMAILVTGLRRAGVARRQAPRRARALRRRPAARARRGRDPRAPADDHRARLPRPLRPRALRIGAFGVASCGIPRTSHAERSARVEDLAAGFERRPPRRAPRCGRTPRPTATRGR